MDTMSLLAVLAHPDDESCGPGGTLARCVGEGMDVRLICATRGEMGGAPVPGKERDDLLAELRTAELRAACAALGVSDCTVLDYPDGSLHNCDQYALEEEIVRVIRRVRPRVIITADAEEDGDHATIAWVTTLAWMSAGVEIGPASGRGNGPHMASLLLYYHPGPLSEDHLVNLDLARVDVSRYREQKAAALRCHVTQTACTSGALRALETGDSTYENFVIAHRSLPDDDYLLTGLFQPLQWAKERVNDAGEGEA